MDTQQVMKIEIPCQFPNLSPYIFQKQCLQVVMFASGLVVSRLIWIQNNWLMVPLNEAGVALGWKSNHYRPNFIEIIFKIILKKKTGNNFFPLYNIKWKI